MRFVGLRMNIARTNSIQIGVAALGAAVLVLVLTRQGPGLLSDTLSYFAYPRSGHLLDLPTHHGIFYPLLLRLLYVPECFRNS